MISKVIPKVGTALVKLLIVFGIFGSVFIELPIFSKNITISVDGQAEDLNIQGLFGKDVITALDNRFGNDGYVLNSEIDTKGFIQDLNNLGIKTKKVLQMNLQTGAAEHVTYVTTVGDLINETQLNYHITDETIFNKALKTQSLVEERVLEEGFATETVENAEVYEGTEKVIQEGRNRRISELYVSTVEVTELIATTVLDEGAAQIIEKGTKPKPTVTTTTSSTSAGAVPSGSVWDQLAYCESGGNWSINTGNGYYGGLQFSAATWRTASQAVGLNIPYAHQATREEQIMAATWLQNRAGWGQWPSCTSKLGLR